MKKNAAEPCACGDARGYAACCAPLHAGAPAPDAAALMRSRYSAFVLGDVPYLLRSWHATTRPETLDLDDDGARRKWLGLSVREHRPLDTDHAEVEFIARYRIGGGSAQRLHERSRFVREQGHWYYVDGELLA